MSRFECPVVDVVLRAHPNADTLSVASIGGYDVVVRTDDWRGWCRGAYVPSDAVVDTRRPEFSFLAPKAKPDGTYRIKPMRLRGVFSMGLLLPGYAGRPIGTDVTAELGVTKYVEPEVLTRYPGVIADGLAAPEPPGPTVKYTDIEHARKFTDQFRPGELVVVTEKIHGANARYTVRNGELHVGSRTRWLKAEKDTSWHQALRNTGLEQAVRDIAPYVLFGEVYGPVQDLKYGSEKPRFVAFDVWDPAEHRYLDYNAFRAVCRKHKIPTVPELHVGAYSLDLVKELAEEDSVLARNDQISEGVVVRPFYEREHHNVGRVILKYPGERYLLRGSKS